MVRPEQKYHRPPAQLVQDDFLTAAHWPLPEVRRLTGLLRRRGGNEDSHRQHRARTAPVP